MEPWTIFAKSFILDIWKSFEYVSATGKSQDQVVTFQKWETQIFDLLSRAKLFVLF